MPRKLNPIVGQANPNLYSAGVQANLAPQEQVFLEQSSFASVEAKRLRSLPIKKAKLEYDRLSTEAKNWLNYLYPDAEYAKPDPTAVQKGLGIAGKTVKGVAKFIASPIITTFKVAGEYGKTINTPYTALRQAAQQNLIGNVRFGSPFAASQEGMAMPIPPNTDQRWMKAWKDGYSGKSSYDLNAVDVAKKKHGDAKIFVAQKILEGKKPGEILEEYGTVDDKIISAMTESLDNPDKFNTVIEDLKFAQTSPGRDLGRMLEKIDIENGGLLGKLIGKSYVATVGGVTRGGMPGLFTGIADSFKSTTQEKYLKDIRRTTGWVDAMYQIAIDPLTYITGGTIKGATGGTKLVEQLIENQRITGDYAASVRETFASRPEVRELWDGELGQLIEKYANAPTKGDKVIVAREIKNKFPGYNNDETIKIFADNGVFNANSAEEFFSQVDNFPTFVSGRLDGTQYYRNGIATARNQRSLTFGIAKAADAIFNPGVATGSDAARAKALNKTGADYIGILKTLGDDVTSGVNIEGIERIVKADEDLKGARKAFIVAGRQMARNPGGSLILIGDDAIKTQGNFRLMAQQLFTRDVADLLSYEFIDSTADEQIVILRNLYAGIMYKLGLHGTPRGTDLMQEILSKTFNNKSGMTTVDETQVPKEFADVMNKNILRAEDELLYLQARGIIHPSQVAQGIAALPYERIIQITAPTKLVKNNKNILKIVDGATRNRLMAEFVNIWTILTLVPRLGVRSAIDEAFFYAINAPLTDLFNYALGGRKAEAVATGYTGSLSAVGPLKQAFNALFRKGGPAKTLTGEQRVEIIKEIAETKNIPIEEVTHLLIRETIADRVISVLGTDNPVQMQDLKDALVNNSNFLNAMANSLGARTSLAGGFDREILDAVFTPSVLTKALNDEKLKVGKKFRSLSTKELEQANSTWLTLAHFDAFFRQFAVNSKGLPNKRTVNPAVVFFSHNGLRTADDFLKAKRDMLEGIGVTWDNVTESYFVKDAESTKAFLSDFGDTVYFRKKGLADGDIAEALVDTMLYDMRYTFHGSGTKFNDNLMTLVKSRYDELRRYERETGKQVAGKWEKATANLPFEEFEKATVGFQPRGRINTAIEFGGKFQEPETLLTAWAKAGDGVMEYMDRQVTGIFRQPAVRITYFRLRQAYRGIEKEFIDKQVAIKLKEKPYLNPDEVLEEATALGKKRFTEIAFNEAIESVLKYVDNPNVRTNFTLSVRNVARFYRATEDFWRRYYRLMREKPLQVIYRMRLAHQGLEARGEVYTDDYGEKYLVLPSDSIINSAVEPVVRKVTGTDFVVPQFNDFTLKLRMVNPSFSPDAGAPVLSGPVAGVSLVGLRWMLGKLPGEAGIYGTKAGEFIDNWALGDFGDNMDVTKALVPLQLQNIARMIPEEEITRQEASAMFQSISYVQAFGDKRSKLPDNPTPQQLDEFLKAHRIAAHNVQFMRSMFSMFAPVTLTPRESKGVPDYYKNNGLVTLRQEFFDILNTLNKESLETAYDPYEVALAMFVGRNPNKTVYTVNRNERKTQFIIQKTNEVVKWSIENKKFLERYGDAAWIFAPQIGDYTPDAFNYLESLDIVEKADGAAVAKYLDRMQTSVVKQKYFDVERQEREALSQTAVVSERRRIIYDATQKRKALLTAYPLLRLQLEGEGLGVGEEEMLLRQVESALVDKTTPIPDMQRKKVSVALKLVKDFISFSKDENIKRTALNFVDAKRGRKLEVQRLLDELMSGDNQIKELNRRVFGPILEFYSRDVYRTY
jgi:hypothetical protein